MLRFLLKLLMVTLAVVPSFGQVTFSSSNLPIVIITTQAQIVDEPKVPGTMGIIDNGPGVRNTVNDPHNDFDGKIGIEIRGSTSQSFPKKQFNIEIRDDTGESIDASLLGFPKKDDWVLFAPYNDKSLMRDVLAYKLGRDLGDYASRSRYCEVVINGDYQGVYVLLEKVKRDKNRINIDKLESTETSGDNVTGGYIIKLDKTSGSGGGGWTSVYSPPSRSGSQTVFFQYDYPKDADIVAEQKTYIKNYVDSFEQALAGDNYADPVNGYAHYIDVPSFIDFFIANEISKNPDAYRLSTYLFKEKDSDGGKLHMGPIWDFNLAFGNVNYCTQGTTDGWVYKFNTICPDDYWLIPFWWDRLFSDEVFRQKLVARWTSLRNGAYKTENITSRVDSVYNLLQESQIRNFEEWGVMGQYIWPNYYVGTSFYAEVSWLKTWILGRLDWMDENIADFVTGVPEASRFSIRAFPNPFYQDINLEVTSDKAGPVTIELFDIMGRRIENMEKNSDGLSNLSVKMSGGSLSPGSYVLRAKSGNRIIREKLIKRP